ncbi:MAG: transporter [Gemmatimonadales bacterium]
MPARAQDANDSELSFFDPLVTLAPGISRELDLLFEHTRTGHERLTLMSAKLQYPVLPWLQFSLEMPAAILEPDRGDTASGAGDLVVAGQAAVLKSRREQVELDVGVELTLPTGSATLLAASTAVRPFVSGVIKLGPLDLIANLSHQWVLAGPVSGVQLFQANAALGYSLDRITPFVELNLIQPVRRVADDRPQLYVLPGLEFFLSWNLSLSVGVQLPLTSARFFDQRVLGFLKWKF